jgi:hypothetical protein
MSDSELRPSALQVLAVGLSAGLLAGLIVALSTLVSQRTEQPWTLLAVWGGTALWLGPFALGWLRLRHTFSTRTLLGGCLLVLGPLALFGAVLKSHTHHRPLGAATFAVGSFVVLALGGLVLVTLGARLAERPRARRLLGAGLAVLAGVSLLVWLLLLVGSSKLASPQSVGPLALGIVFGLWYARADRPVPSVSVVSLVFLLVVVVGGLATGRASDLGAQAGACLGVFALFE